MSTSNERILRNALQQSRDLLSALNWPEGGTDQTSWTVCPICGEDDFRGHQKDCHWIRVIALVDKTLEDIPA